MGRRGLAAIVLILVFAIAGCATSEPAVTASPGSGLRQYDDYNEMVQALGFDIPRIEGAGYVPQSYSIIDGEIAQIIYSNGDFEVNIRVAKNENSDISGVNGAAYNAVNISGVEVHIGAYKNIQSAWFVAGDTDYGMSASNVTPTDWEAFVTQFITGLVAS